MLIKSILFFIVAAYFIQPNEAIVPELQAAVDASIRDFIVKSRDALINATAGALQIISTLETGVQNTLIFVQGQVNATMQTINNNIQSAVGFSSRINSCIAAHSTQIAVFQQSTFSNISGCVMERVTAAVNVATSIINSTILISNTIEKFSSKLAITCPQPAFGDLFGSLLNTYCSLNELGTATLIITGQGFSIAANVVTATAIIAGFSTLQTDMPTCFITRSATALINAGPIISSIESCATSSTTQSQVGG